MTKPLALLTRVWKEVLHRFPPTKGYLYDEREGNYFWVSDYPTEYWPAREVDWNIVMETLRCYDKIHQVRWHGASYQCLILVNTTWLYGPIDKDGPYVVLQAIARAEEMQI